MSLCPFVHTQQIQGARSRAPEHNVNGDSGPFHPINPSKKRVLSREWSLLGTLTMYALDICKFKPCHSGGREQVSRCQREVRRSVV